MSPPSFIHLHLPEGDEMPKIPSQKVTLLCIVDP